LQTSLTKKQNENKVAIYAAMICFLTYVSVYAFRKPFTVCSFANEVQVLGISYKSMLVIAQLLGYMSSKFFGIKFISERKNIGRGKIILLLVAIAWLSLLLFAIIPSPFNIVFLFTNGFPLGLLWGIVFSYVEGRRATDFIGAVLAVSFIFSSGLVKSIATLIQNNFDITEFWLPFFTGLAFVLPLLLFVYLIEKIPTPSENDIQHRTVRKEMTKAERSAFLKQFSTGIICLVIVYVLLTIFRDIRDNFTADIWKDAGFAHQPEKFLQTEIPITLIVLLITGSLVFIKKNVSAFLTAHVFVLAGFCLAGIASYLFLHQQLPVFNWMLFVGLGLYAGYIPFNCMLYDRLVASFKASANVGFLMYVSDSFGYLGSVLVTISKNFFNIQIQWSTYYAYAVVGLSVVGIAFIIVSAFYFKRKHSAEIKKATV
jgi:MFS family permease